MAAARRRFLARLAGTRFLLPVTLTGYLALKGALPSWGLPGFPCPLRALTGIPCPTCFLTRATCASLAGRWQEALSLHAFGPPVAAALVLWSLAALRSRRLLPPWPWWPWIRVPPPGPRSLTVAALGLLSYWALRLTLQFGLGFRVFPAG